MNPAMHTDAARIRKALGAEVRRRRLRLGLTQEKLAERAQLHPTYVGAIERGERNVSLHNIVRLSRALQTKPSALLDGLE
ncbi:MAG: helix-turn-helix domain-containing protein [bacterium]